MDMERRRRGIGVWTAGKLEKKKQRAALGPQRVPTIVAALPVRPCSERRP
jgi:hypothetical protein